MELFKLILMTLGLGSRSQMTP